MNKEMTDLEFLQVTTPRSQAVMNAIRGNLADLHPEDKCAFLGVIQEAVTALLATHKTEACAEANKGPSPEGRE